MKKLLVLLVAGLTLSFVFTSCEKEELFDETLLIGRWVSGTVYFRYMEDYSGYTWDPSDDVEESEAQPFTWTLNKSELTQIHIMQIGGNIPKVYTVLELTPTRLKYKDDFNTFTFTKVN
jgi:hypothetical protein